MSDATYIDAPKDCDFHAMRGVKVTAEVDGRTHDGPWANMCAECFIDNGKGLGTGLGQRLIVGERPVLADHDLSGRNLRSQIMAAIEAGDFDDAEDLIGDGDLYDFI